MTIILSIDKLKIILYYNDNMKQFSLLFKIIHKQNKDKAKSKFKVHSFKILKKNMKNSFIKISLILLELRAANYYICDIVAVVALIDNIELKSSPNGGLFALWRFH